VDWRFWKRKTAVTVEETAPSDADATQARVSAPPGAAEAPRLDSFAFEAAPAPEPVDPAAAAEDVRNIVRSKTRRRLSAEPTPRPLAVGFEPVLVPSLRGQALVYRLAAEQRAAAPAEALDFWNAYLELCPDDGDAWFALGHARLALGHMDEAAAAFGEARRCAPRDALPIGALGYVAGCAGDWDGAVRLLTEAIVFAPQDAELWARLAEAQERAGHAGAAHESRQRLETLRTS
jgi:tetratricopeptide (TPR) repeat protein